MSQAEAARRAGISASQLSRLERSAIARPSLEQLCRAGRAVGLRCNQRWYPTGEPVHDRVQLALLARFEALAGPPLRVRREVPLPIPGDLRAWDARVSDGRTNASVEAESKVMDAQALQRRIELKVRDDPDAGAVILVLNRTTHNREMLRAHREAFRALLPLDGASIMRSLRRGQVPPLGGVLLL